MRAEIVGVRRRPGSGAHRGIARSARQVDTKLNLAGRAGLTKLNRVFGRYFKSLLSLNGTARVSLCLALL